MKKSTVSRLLSMTLALSMTLGSGSMAVFADDDASTAEEVETVVVAEEDVDAASGTAVKEDEETSEEDTAVETVVQPEEAAAPTETTPAEEIVVEEATADDAAEIEVIADEETEQTDAALAEAVDEEFYTGSGYVLMNIPYSAFYAADNVKNIDIVASATQKSLNMDLAAGTYHTSDITIEHASDARILGITYPVYVSDRSVLKDYKRITDEDKGNVVRVQRNGNKNEIVEKELTGADLLEASGDYAFYALETEPSNYKTLSVENGVLKFSDVKKGPEDGGVLAGEATYGGHHTNVTYEVASEALANVVVNAVVVTTSDETKYALRHVWDIWRITQLGWNWEDLDGDGLAGKTIKNVKYYVKSGDDYKVLSYDVNVALKKHAKETIAAAFDNNSKIKVSGLPEDIENPKATVSSVVPRGETAVVIADDVDIAEGTITTTDKAIYGTEYTVKVISDNYADISLTVKCLIEEMKSATIGGLTYFYADTKDDEAATVYQASVRSKAGSTVYNFTKADLTKVGVTDYYYGVATGVTPLSGTLYAYENGTGKATTYKEVYDGLGVETDASYDAISSATHYTGYHAKDIPSLVTYGTDAEGNKEITGLTLGRAVKTVDAVAYVEASILKAAGEKLTEEQAEVAATVLKVNPMDKPADSTITQVLFSAEYTSSRYGTGEFVIVPDEKVEGYVWSEYWNSVYAATISDGTTTAGAVHWIDMYGEAATSGHHYNRLEIALNNGESVGSNKSNVTRYAAFYDENNAFKDGTYTIKVYAEGYDVLEAEVKVTAKADQAAAANAEALIKAANGKFATAADAQKAVDAAKKAFDDLTDAQKAMLLASMSDAESQLTAAQTAATAQKTAEVNAAKQKNENKTDNKKQTVTKQSQSLKKLTPATKKLKASKLKKKKQTFKLKATINGKGKVTFKKVSGNKKIKISKAGKVTVKKGLKKGTYKVKVKVSIAATGNYTAASATKTIKIKVK